MNTLIKKALIIDESSKFNNTKKDILISNKIIVEIADNIENENAQVIEFDNLHLSAGWIDLKANFCEPGFEERETLETGCNAAKNGGFTQVVLSPSTNPPIQSKSQIEFIINKSIEFGIKILPLGAATINQEGKQMAELYDMYNSGAVGFTDDKNSIENAQLFTSILQYANNFGAKLFHYACDKNISHKTIGHDGLAATSIGFKGQPAIAEDIIVARDITIAEYYNLPIHFSTISTSGSVALIKNAKAKGIKVTCDVAAHQIFFSDNDLKTFDTNLKVMPPLRDDYHRKALIAGLADGTIDAICSDHSPQNIENKFVEFDHAHFGMSSIESAFSMANTVLKNQLSIHQIIQKFTIAPASILNRKINSIDIGQPANITLFNPEQKFNFNSNVMKSKGKNSPLDGYELLGKPMQVIC